MKEIIADSGPLIVLARSGLLEVLRKTVGDTVVPATVLSECIQEPNKPGAKAIWTAKSEALLRVVPDAQGDWPRTANLDKGESAVLRLALMRKSPVLMDERQGRKVARLLGIPVIGSAGVLLKAKLSGLIQEVGPILGQWKGFGYYHSPELIRGILEKAGE